MQITVTIPDEIAAQVQARGLTPESYVEKLIEDDAAHRITFRAPSPRRNMAAFFEAMTANSEGIPQLPEEAFKHLKKPS